ncbi:putative MFS family arabinose efflux permease [Dongia mobilis]|uniref:Putative MFS family arabinose efflux permease n=1 Tax=Dongia mobilis TaxID=578943 RepID=A0A4R6WTP1_9PROT|nr:MFS transporter [Dongia mobilis]TDQ83418.1 putative MFS family arabinose efflux permease [Dongia mobilis]
MPYHLMIAALGVAQIVSWGILFYTFPLLAGPIGHDLTAAKDQVYVAATLALLVSGLAAYPLGAAIDRGHGRLVLLGGSVLGGGMFAALALVDSLAGLYLVFVGVGLALAMSLYEPAFAVLVHRLGGQARAAITTLTLWGGFASTVFIPFDQFLLDRLDWREAVLVLAAIQIVIGGGCNALAVRGPAAPAVAEASAHRARTGWPVLRWALGRRAFWGLVVTNVCYAATYIALTYHLYPLLIERGFDPATAVAGIAIFGPAQVAGRVLVWLFGRNRPVRLIGSIVIALFPAAFAIAAWMPADFRWLAAFAILLGAANGILTIVRGLAVPELLTRDGYGALNGAISLPATLAKGAAPFLAAQLWSLTGSYQQPLIYGIAGTAVMAAGFWLAAWRGAGPTPGR